MNLDVMGQNITYRILEIKTEHKRKKPRRVVVQCQRLLAVRCL